MKRDYPERPIVGVGVIVFRGDEVLLVRRAQEPRRGQWSLPGGAQELGETVADTARREVLEETDITIGAVEMVTVVDLIDRDDRGRVRHHYTLIDVWAEAASEDPKPGSDAAQAAFKSPDELPGLGLWEETIRVIEMARRQRL